MTSHPGGGADPQQLRAQLHGLTETIEPAPDYLERLRPRLRPARRRRIASTVTAAGLAVAIGAAAVVVGLLAHDRQQPAAADLPRTLVALAFTPPPRVDPGLFRSDPARVSDVMDQYTKARRTALLRLDTTPGRVLSVLYRKQGSGFAWSLRGDGSAVIGTAESRCSFDLRAVGLDGQGTALGAVPGFQGNTGSSIASFAFSRDGRLLAVTGTSCPDRGGVLHWRIAVYRVGATVDPHPLLSVTVPDQPGGQFPNPAGPSFSADGRHVVFPFETGQGSFDPAHGVSGHIVTGFLDVDLAHPASAPVRRTLRLSQPSCLVYHDHLLFGRDPSALVSLEGCPGKQHLVSVDLASGRVRPLLTLPSQPLVLASTFDFDANRTRLLVQSRSAIQLGGPMRLFVWDGGQSLRLVLELKEITVDGVTYVLSPGAQW
jgi:hypothetical protein